MWMLIVAVPLLLYGGVCCSIFTAMKLRRDRGISPRCSQTDLRILN
jgi:hypothetical protein